MTEDSENNKTLKLGSNKTLTLSKSSDTSEIKHNFGRGKSRTVTVEVKKSKNLIKEKNQLNAEAAFKSEFVNNNLISQEADQTGLTVGERQTRINALKVAAQQSEEEKKKTVAKEELKKESSIEERIDEQAHSKNQVVTDNITQEEIPEEKQSIKPLMRKDEGNLADLTEEDAEASANKKSVKVDKKALSVKSTREEKWTNKYHLSHLLRDGNDLDEEAGERRKFNVRRYSKQNKSNHSSTKREKIVREVIIPDNITIQELASRMAERSGDVIKELAKMGVTATLNQTIDGDTAELLVMTLGHTSKRVSEYDIEKGFNIQMAEEVDKSNLVIRAPIVTVMGHVDHGKTSLLDALRSSNIAQSEAGGITQHVGAYKIVTKTGKEIVFLDTPGHEAFTAIRSRGAKCTDIVVLVVAADDGVMPQTIEAINHAKAAEVPIVVAINKIDKPAANAMKVKSELLNYEVVLGDFGGDVLSVEISAKEKMGLDELEEAILMQAEILELTANPNRAATGAVIESKMDKGRGIVTHILVQNGTLKIGDIVVMGTSFGKIKKIVDDKGKSLHTALPSTPVEITGLNSIADAGSSFVVIADEKEAREIADFRKHKEKESKNSNMKRASVEEFLATSEGKTKELRLVIKADAHGSLEAINGSLSKLVHEEVKMKIVHSAIGAITESDTNLAQISNALVLGFNVREEAKARISADKNGIDIRYYSIIYNLVDDVKALLSGLLDPLIREVYLGTAECRQIFDITKVGKIAGSQVIKGIIKRGANVRLLRNNVVIYEGKLRTLRRFKDDVKEVREGYECGIGFENYSDIREGDTVEAYELIEEKREL